jgi:uncharacterized protein YdaU (DUF1376 family)
MTMSLEAQGAYIRLLCYQWDNSGIPGRSTSGQPSPKDLAKIFATSSRQATHLWGEISGKFSRGDDGLWRNARLEKVRSKQKSFQGVAKDGGKARAANARRDRGKFAPADAPADAPAENQHSDLRSPISVRTSNGTGTQGRSEVPPPIEVRARTEPTKEPRARADVKKTTPPSRSGIWFPGTRGIPLQAFLVEHEFLPALRRELRVSAQEAAVYLRAWCTEQDARADLASSARDPATWWRKVFAERVAPNAPYVEHPRSRTVGNYAAAQAFLNRCRES